MGKHVCPSTNARKEMEMCVAIRSVWPAEARKGKGSALQFLLKPSANTSWDSLLARIAASERAFALENKVIIHHFDRTLRSVEVNKPVVVSVMLDATLSQSNPAISVERVLS